MGKRRGGLLLFGPPVRGKTYLTRALCGELDATFMAIDRDSRFHVPGQSVSTAKETFEEARGRKPSLSSEQLSAAGNVDCLTSVPGPQAGENRRHVMVDRAGREEEQIGDIGVGQTFT
jgi:ATP-dependent Zn protease